MVTRKMATPSLHAANLTADQMRSGILKLQRRISDLESFDPSTIKERSDPRLGAIESKLEDTIS